MDHLLVFSASLSKGVMELIGPKALVTLILSQLPIFTIQMKSFLSISLQVLFSKLTDCFNWRGDVS